MENYKAGQDPERADAPLGKTGPKNNQRTEKDVEQPTATHQDEQDQTKPQPLAQVPALRIAKMQLDEALIKKRDSY